jgi:NAD(P)-dependent dehydrogenase (short-subunit alcohol dehydrogenase family)
MPGSRVVVITGASGKLGRVVAERFAREGDRLALIARSRAALDELRGSLPIEAGDHIAIPADLLDESHAQAAAKEIRRHLGIPSILLHLVGRYAGGVALEEADEVEFRSLLETNLWSTFHVLRAFLPDIRAAAAGRIVTVSTPLASAPGPNIAGYVASKAAVEALTLAVARELAGTAATANVVLIRTIGDAKPTHTRPEEIAEAMVWLASPEAGAVNGQRIPVVGRG